METKRDFLTAEQLSERLQVPIATVYGWNHKKVGPRFAKIGKHVRYRVADVDRWIEAQYDRKPVAR